MPLIRERLRSHSGCDQCRRRRKKCDELRPVCSACSRLQLSCSWGNPQKRGAGAKIVFELPTVQDARQRASPAASAAALAVERSTTSTALGGRRGSRASDGDGHGAGQEDVQDSASYLEDILRIYHDPMNYSTSVVDNEKHQQLFNTVVCPKIMPMAVRFNLHMEGNENVILSAARNFPPLYHAICAITLLNGGLRQRPELLAGSFRHYEQAILACRYRQDKAGDAEARFLLHFVLLMYDISCASQRFPQERSSWAVHTACLADIVYKTGRLTSRLTAYLSWYALFLDSQAGLLGNPEAGNFARAYLNNGRWLPQWPVAVAIGGRAAMEGDLGKFLQAHKLSLTTFELFAEQSQLTLDVQRSADTKQSADTRARVAAMSMRHLARWNAASGELLGDESEEDFLSRTSPITASTYTFARFQFSVLSLSLASMYPDDQLLVRTTAERSAHCRNILDYVKSSVQRGDKENHHLASGIFLAACSTDHRAEQDEAFLLLSAIEHAGLAGAVRRTRTLLEVVLEQKLNERTLVKHNGAVDYLGLIQSQPSKYIVLGM